MSRLVRVFSRSPQVRFGILASLGGLGLCVALYVSTTWNPYLVWLAGWSIMAFGLYGYDKWQARRRGLRVPKVVLHALALAGGFGGAWLGMALFRHKIRQPDFFLVLLLSTALHAALAYYWFLR